MVSFGNSAGKVETSSPISPIGRFGLNTGLAFVLIVCAAFAAYRNSFSGTFVYDDIPAIRENGSIRQLALPSAWLLPPANTTVEGRPVLNLTLAVNFAISGTDVWSYHAINLLIHICAGLTLFGIVRRTLDRTAGTSGGERGVFDADLMALAVAVLWIVHPLQTEAVTYIIQRAESLMGLFYFQALYCFIRGSRESDGNGSTSRPGLWQGLAVVACLLGMATKEVMATAPLIVLLYDRTFVSGTFREAWRRHWKQHLALMATWGLLFYLVALSGADRSGSKGFGTAVSWWSFILTQFPAITRYVCLSFWPSPLVLEYGTFWINRVTEILPSVLLVVALLGASLWALRARMMSGFLAASFFAILAPTSLLPGIGQMIAEHRMYLPLAAILALVVPALYSATGRHPFIFASIVTIVAILFCTMTDRRNADYSSEIKLWGDTIAKRPNNAIARINFGNALLEAGRTTEAVAQYEVARQIDTKPDYAVTHNNLGIALDRTGHLAEAIAQFETAIDIAPEYADAHCNLGIALHKAGRTEAAIAQFEAALKNRPDYAEAHYNLGTSFGEQRQMPEAISNLPRRFASGQTMRRRIITSVSHFT